MLAQGQSGTNLLLINLVWKLDFQPWSEILEQCLKGRNGNQGSFVKEPEDPAVASFLSDTVSFHFRHADILA